MRNFVVFNVRISLISLFLCFNNEIFKNIATEAIIWGQLLWDTNTQLDLPLDCCYSFIGLKLM